MLPEGLTNIPLASFGPVERSGVRIEDFGVGARASTGVGGVTVVNGVFDPALVGVCGRIFVSIGGRPGLKFLGRSEGSVFLSAMTGGKGMLVVGVSARASSALTPATSTSTTLPWCEPLSGPIFGLLLDFPG